MKVPKVVAIVFWLSFIALSIKFIAPFVFIKFVEPYQALKKTEAQMAQRDQMYENTAARNNKYSALMRCAQIQEREFMSPISYFAGAQGFPRNNDRALCDAEAKRLDLKLAAADGCLVGPSVTDANGGTHNSWIIVMYGLDSNLQCRFANELVVVENGNTGKASAFLNYFDAVERIQKKLFGTNHDIRSLPAPLRPKVSETSDGLTLDYSPAFTGKLVVTSNGQIMDSTSESHVLTNSELSELVYKHAIPALIKAGYIGGKTKILPQDDDLFPSYESLKRRIACIEGGAVGNLVNYQTDGVTKLTFLFSRQLDIAIANKNLELNNLKHAQTPQPCKVDDSEIRLAPYRQCKTDSDCVLDKRTTTCSDEAANRKSLRELNAFLPHYGCVETTRCNSVKCIYKVCIPRGCVTSAI